MKASKFSDAQKAFILKQGDDGVPVAEICHHAETCRQFVLYRPRRQALQPREHQRRKGHGR